MQPISDSGRVQERAALAASAATAQCKSMSQGADFIARISERTAEGLRIRVRLTPRGGRAAVGGLAELGDGRYALAARVSAPPVDGAANAALLECLAKALGTAKSRLSLVSGETARVKMVAVLGDPQVLEARLASLAG